MNSQRANINNNITNKQQKCGCLLSTRWHQKQNRIWVSDAATGRHYVDRDDTVCSTQYNSVLNSLFLLQGLVHFISYDTGDLFSHYHRQHCIIQHLCVMCVLHQSWHKLKQLHLVPEHSPHPDMTLATLCHLSCVIQLFGVWWLEVRNGNSVGQYVNISCVSRLFQTFIEDFSLQFVDLVFLLICATIFVNGVFFLTVSLLLSMWDSAMLHNANVSKDNTLCC